MMQSYIIFAGIFLIVYTYKLKYSNRFYLYIILFIPNYNE